MLYYLFHVDAITKLFQKQNFSSLTLNTFGKWTFMKVVLFSSVDEWLVLMWTFYADNSITPVGVNGTVTDRNAHQFLLLLISSWDFGIPLSKIFTNL